MRNKTDNLTLKITRFVSIISESHSGSAPRPGEISLAHAGVLLLDEFAEFGRGALEVMRQPLEDGAISISRAIGTFRFPARFMLVASMNPCPCGFHGIKDMSCKCDDGAIDRYAAKLSGPLLDRIDLHVDVARVPFDDLIARASAEKSASVRIRVEAARGLQHARLQATPFCSNASIVGAHVRRHCALDARGIALLRIAAARGRLSARAFDRIARVARTIADLEGSEQICEHHVAEAIGYRSLERRGLAA